MARARRVGSSCVLSAARALRCIGRRASSGGIARTRIKGCMLARSVFGNAVCFFGKTGWMYLRRNHVVQPGCALLVREGHFGKKSMGAQFIVGKVRCQRGQAPQAKKLRTGPAMRIIDRVPRLPGSGRLLGAGLPHPHF